MHKEQKEWCESVKKQFPSFFRNNVVLEIGSLDVNGSNRYLFDACTYIGVDVIAGNGVDVVSIAHEISLSNNLFNVILSTNALEHDMYLDKTLKKMYDLLRVGGLLFFQACSIGWKEHGTLKTSPHNSGTSKISEEWANYYKNVTEDDIKGSLDFTKFSTFKLETVGKDITFWGFKDS